jgi:uncharacterized protein YjbJ (UPF0337 family)
MNAANERDTAKSDLTPAASAAKPEIKPAARRVSRSRALPSSTELKGRWKQRIGAARIAWGKLTEDELLKVEGHEQKLSGLIQQRYAITRDEALRQVKAFFYKHRP